MRPRVALPLLVLTSAASTAHAQSPRAGGPAVSGDATPRVALDLTIGGNLARGFVDREMVAARGIVEASWGPWAIYTQPYWLFGRVHPPMGPALTTDNEVYDRTGLYRRISGPWFAYAVNAYDRSVRRQIDHRDLLGGGVGATVWKCRGSSLLAAVGTLYEVTSFSKTPTLVDADDHVLGTSTGIEHEVRFSVRIYGRYKLAGGKLNLTHDLIVIPSYRDPADDYRILAFGALTAPIAKGFSLVVQADATQEGVIAMGTQHGDLAVTFGLSYKNEWRATPPAPAP